jgi:hypothetical protein
MEGSSHLLDVSQPRRRVWQPLHAALALLTTLSETFAHEVAADSGADKCIALGLTVRIVYKEKFEGVKIPIVKSCEEAWLELRSLIEDGVVLARGTAVDRHRQGPGTIDYSQPPGRLGPEQASQLVLWDEPEDGTWLRPDDKSIFGQGRHWKKVSVHWPSLMKAVFGKAHQQKATKPGPDSTGPRIREAFDAEFPAGAPKDMRMKEVHERVATRLNMSHISKKTLERHGITKDKIRRKN